MNAKEIILEDIISRAKHGKNLICSRRQTATQYCLLENLLILSYGAVLTSAIYVYLKKHTGRKVYLYSLLGSIASAITLEVTQKNYKSKVLKELNCDEKGLDEALKFYRYAFTDKNQFYETNNKH